MNIPTVMAARVQMTKDICKFKAYQVPLEKGDGMRFIKVQVIMDSTEIIFLLLYIMSASSPIISVNIYEQVVCASDDPIPSILFAGWLDVDTVMFHIPCHISK
jgi:hypothetical protein